MLLLVGLSLPFLPPQAARGAQWQGTLSGGWHAVRNVKEKIDASSAEDDALFRFLIELRPPEFRTKRLGLEGRIKGGVDRYVRFIEESRWIAEGRVNGGWTVGPRKQLSLSAWGFHQSFPDRTERDFSRLGADVGYRAPLPSRWAAGVSLDFHSQDFQRTRFHDETGWGFRLSLARSLGRGFTGELRFRIAEDDFGRPSFKYQVIGDQAEASLGPDQEDSIRSLGLHFQRVRPFVLRAGYTFTSRRSNSYGFSCRQHDFTFVSSVALPWDADLQVLGVLRLTDYTDAGVDTVIVPRVGEEIEARDDDNSITVRIRRPLWDGPMFELHWAGYRNESLLVDRFYTKWLLGAAIRWGFHVEQP